jgi:hypothetical protein
MDRYDGLVVVGLGLLAGGFYWAWPPLGLIVPGAVLMLLGILGASRAAVPPEQEEG